MAACSCFPPEQSHRQRRVARGSASDPVRTQGKGVFAAAISTSREHACRSQNAQQNLNCDNSVLLDLQLSTRKKDIQAFSGFTFTDDQQASRAFSASAYQQHHPSLKCLPRIASSSTNGPQESPTLQSSLSVTQHSSVSTIRAICSLQTMS